MKLSDTLQYNQLVATSLLPIEIPRVPTTPNSTLLLWLSLLRKRLISLIPLLLLRLLRRDTPKVLRHTRWRTHRLLGRIRSILDARMLRVQTRGTLETLSSLTTRKAVAIRVDWLLLLRTGRRVGRLLLLLGLGLLGRVGGLLWLLLLLTRRVAVPVIHRTFVPACGEFLRVSAVQGVDAVWSDLP